MIAEKERANVDVLRDVRDTERRYCLIRVNEVLLVRGALVKTHEVLQREHMTADVIHLHSESRETSKRASGTAPC